MNSTEKTLDSRQGNQPLSNYKLAIEVLLVVFLVMLDGYGYIPISQTLFIFGLLLISLKVRKEGWSSIGFRRSARFKRNLIIGLSAGIFLEIFAAFVTTPLISDLAGIEPDYSSFEGIRGNIGMLVFFIILSWILGAFGEEICFRGYLMRRLSQLFRKSSKTWVISLILSSVLFGYGHTDQGIAGWFQEGLSGLYLGILFLTTGKNLTAPIVSHGVSNTLAFILMYFGVYPGVGY